MDALWVTVAAFIGGILSALLGWQDSGEPFNPRKFGRSIIAAILAAIGVAIRYNYANGITPIDLLSAVLVGAGVDVLSNRAIGAIAAKTKEV